MKLWSDVFNDEKKYREALNPANLCRFGITTLDDSIKYIMPNDLIVIGADSGVGKTELAIQICKTNIRNGRSVAYFNFEGGETEIISRLKWQFICDLYYAEYSHEGIDMDYLAWRTNTIEKREILKSIEDRIFEKMKKDFSENLWLYEVREGLKVEAVLADLQHSFNTLEDMLTTYKAGMGGKLGIDLVIIDHLQYFELAGNQNEIMQTTSILKEVKKISDVFNTPVVLISHLRKKTKDRGIPDQEDFYGSSNIPKISTCSIIVHSDSKVEDFSSNVFPTYFRVVKSRYGIRSNYCMKTNFDLTKRQYDSEYSLFLVNQNGEIYKDPVPVHRLPKWVNRKNLKRLNFNNGEEND